MPNDRTTPRVPEGLDTTAGIRELFRQFGPSYRWWVTFTSMLGSFASLLTGTIINVAIPDVMGALGMTPDDAQWLSTGFLAATTVTMLLAAWAIETFGMARTYIASMGIFLVGSVMGGVADSGDALIVSRLVQGAGSGLMTPVSMLIVFQVFPMHRRGTAMGIYSVGVVLAPALGPALGGWLIDHLSWRYVFFVAVPFAMISIPLALLFMPAREADARSPRFDWTGVVLLSVFLVTMLTALSNGERQGWGSDLIALLGFAALTSGIAFVYWEAYARDPMFNLALFRNRRFVAASVVTFVIGFGLYGSTYIVPLFLQTIQGLIATDSGLLMLPAGLVMAVVFPIAGRMSDALAPRNIIIAGVLLFGASSLLFGAVDANTPFASMVIWIVIGRIGLGLVFPCLNVTALRPLPLDLLAQGSGAINFLRQLGGAFGVNLLTIFLDQRTSFHVDALTQMQSPASSAARELLERTLPIYHHAGVPELFANIASMRVLGSMLYSQGSMMAFRDTFLIVAAVFFLCLIPAWFMDNRPPTRQ